MSARPVSILALATLRTVSCALCTAAAPVAAATGVWRPTKGDVDSISWGRPAKKKGTGSRGVPHRLNDDERTLYDIAREKGFVELRGSGWRRERSDAPLRNTYRSWCDATAKAAIFVHKGGDGVDEVVIDFSPLRAPEHFASAASLCLEEDGAADGCVEPHAPRDVSFMELAGNEQDEEGVDAAAATVEAASEAYRTLPIYRLPMYAVSWVRPRSDAKALAKALAQRFATGGKAGAGRAKSRGAPQRKAGKSRRHGGYGIG